MRILIVLFALSVSTAAQQAQEPPNPQKLFEAGHYEQAITAIRAEGGQASPAAIYLAGQSFLRLNRPDEARVEFAKLATEGEATPWSLVGRSATALVGGDTKAAIDAASQAVKIAPDQFYPNYQLGFAYSMAEQWESAAESFEKAVTIAPTFAYAHYYAGLACSNLKRVSRMATHFEYFLKLAPEAPERPAVETLMRRIR